MTTARLSYAPDLDGLFIKQSTPAGTAAELYGWSTVSGHLPVPALHDADPGTGRLSYEDVFASGRCHALLGDLITAADHAPKPSAIEAVTSLIDEVCDSLLGAADATGRVLPMSQCRSGLYANRVRPGGRIDTWYRHAAATALGMNDLTGDGSMVLSDLHGWTLIANGRRLRIDVPTAIHRARAALQPDGVWVTALTQGDPTEPNIAAPLCWLDLEHAGRNTLAGDIAVLLWYLLGMGGWLVPTYRPHIHAATQKLPPHHALPRLHVEMDPRTRTAEVRYRWFVGAGRSAAITRFTHRIRTDLMSACGWHPDTALTRLSPLLAARLLGVIPLSRFTGPDLLLLLTKLAELADPTTSLRGFTVHTIGPVPPRVTPGRPQ